MSIEIVTDSGADLEPEDYDNYRIGLVPLGLSLDGRVYSANQSFNRRDFYRLLAATKVFPKTSQPAPAEFDRLFAEEKNKGNEVIYIALSSSLSGTYQTANVVKAMGEYDHVHIVDSKTVSLCQKLMVLYAAQLRDLGKNTEEIVAALEEIRGRLRIFAGLDTLEYLRRGGRLGRTEAGLGNLARIKPVVSVDADGNVRLVSKCIGKGRAMKEIAGLLEEEPADQEFPIYSLYTGSTENTMELLTKLKECDIPPKHMFCVGPVIGAHVGPGAYGIAYVKRKEGRLASE